MMLTFDAYKKARILRLAAVERANRVHKQYPHLSIFAKAVDVEYAALHALDAANRLHLPRWREQYEMYRRETLGTIDPDFYREPLLGRAA